MCVVASVDIPLLTAGLRAEPRQHTKNGKKLYKLWPFYIEALWVNSCLTFTFSHCKPFKV